MMMAVMIGVLMKVVRDRSLFMAGGPRRGNGWVNKILWVEMGG